MLLIVRCCWWSFSNHGQDSHLSSQWSTSLTGNWPTSSVSTAVHPMPPFSDGGASSLIRCRFTCFGICRYFIQKIRLPSGRFWNFYSFNQILSNLYTFIRNFSGIRIYIVFSGNSGTLHHVLASTSLCVEYLNCIIFFHIKGWWCICLLHIVSIKYETHGAHSHAQPVAVGSH